VTVFSLYQYTHRESGKKYIGVTSNLVSRRRAHASGSSGAITFNRAMKKYGPAAFDFRVLAIFDRVDAAAYHEQAVIKKFNTLAPYGFNLVAGAPFTRYAGVHSEETKQKLSKAKIGHHPTEKTRQKMSKSMKGNQRALGHHHTEATKQICSEAAKRRPPRIDYHPTEETKQKIAKAMMGNQFHAGYRDSAKTRQKKSIAQKRRYANKPIQKLSKPLRGAL